MSSQPETTLIFPHQLFDDHPAVMSGRPVTLIEDSLFFDQYKFHKNKLVLHRASMMHYRQRLLNRGFKTNYVNAGDLSLGLIFRGFSDEKIRQVHYCHTTDYLLERRLKRFAARYGIQLVEYPNPNFICTISYLNSWFEHKNRYFLTEFYIEQRKRFSILMNGQQPAGGAWTYDTENRKKMPPSVNPPAPLVPGDDEFRQEAKAYVSVNFAANPGSVSHFNYAVTHEEAKNVLDDFLKNRLALFGTYQDAIVKKNSFLFHSLLTPCLNIGLLSPQEILAHAADYSMQHSIPINSLEGFIRQVLGWREFVRAVYEREGTALRLKNHWDHRRKIPVCFWEGTTGIEPVDDVIRKVIRTGYCHHIERLMILGNFMLLCEFDPGEVYRWFMEMFIDSYDWVMVPNVYGMSQYADGGNMSTKPYISGSNYVLKMSDYKKGEWCNVWDGLYWRFIELHQAEFIRNPRMSMMVKQFEKMDPERKASLRTGAEGFLNQLDV